MIVNDSSCSNVCDSWNYHQLSWPFERALSIWFVDYALWQITHGFMSCECQWYGRDGLITSHILSLLFAELSIAFSFIPVIIYPIRTVFSSKCPKIVIKDTNSSHNPPTPSSKSCDLVDQEKARLNEGKLLKICSRLYFNPIRSSFSSQKRNW